jgi:MtN3 and saliva related transmembrane protein
MLVILLVGLSLWIWYGCMKTDWPIIVTNGFSLIVNVLIVGVRWYYKKTNKLMVANYAIFS